MNSFLWRYNKAIRPYRQVYLISGRPSYHGPGKTCRWSQCHSTAFFVLCSFTCIVPASATERMECSCHYKIQATSAADWLDIVVNSWFWLVYLWIVMVLSIGMFIYLFLCTLSFVLFISYVGTTTTKVGYMDIVISPSPTTVPISVSGQWAAGYLLKVNINCKYRLVNE